jgi:hypothetical protein
MPIEYRIDHERRTVVAQGRGILTREDALAYQKAVWSRPELATYDELMDMTDVEQIVSVGREGALELAHLAAETDPPSARPRFAIVAPSDFAYGLGRMYQVYRNLDERGTKSVGVFRSHREAMAFLGRRAE